MILAWLTASMPIHAEGEVPDDQYLQIYRIIDQGDLLIERGQADLAKERYKEAQIALLNFKKSNPTWDAKLVSFRLNYLEGKISPPAQAISAPAESAALAVAVTTKPDEKSKPKSKPAKAVTATSPSPVKLLSAGAEPRKALRIHPKTGDKQSLVMTMKMAMEMSAGQPMKMPAMIMPMEVTVKSVSADGDIVSESVIGEASVANDPGVMPQMAEAMKTSIGGMKGLAFTSTMSDLGINKGIEVKLPPDASPQLRQSMDQMKESMSSMSSPLPEEAVGLGAKWEMAAQKKMQGMTIDQIVTYELVSIEGDRITFKCAISQNAANQKVANPAAPQIKTELTKMTGNGTGTMTFNLTQAVPSLFTVDSHTDMAMAVNAGGKKQDMTMKMDMNIRMESK